MQVILPLGYRPVTVRASGICLLMQGFNLIMLLSLQCSRKGGNARLRLS